LAQDLTQLVFICGGKGSRLRGSSAAGLPKSLTKVGGEPIVSRLIKNYLPLHTSKSGPVFIVAQGDQLTPTLIRDLLGSKAIIVEQPSPDGVANAILLAAPHLTGHALVFLGDIVLKGEFSRPLPTESAVCIWKEAPDDAISQNFGVGAVNDSVVSLVEKPATPQGLLCGIGVYVLTREFISQFADAPINPVKGEREITEALKYVLSRGYPLRTFQFSGVYVNINRLADRSKAEEILRNMPDGD
jgi:glucose-1-phosphate thymidylyltransferase